MSNPNKDHPQYEHVKEKAKQYFGMELMDDNFEKCRKLVLAIEYNKKGVKRSRQAIRRLTKGLK